MKKMKRVAAWRDSRKGRLLCEKCASDPNNFEKITRRWPKRKEECFMCELCLKVYNRHVDREKKGEPA